MGSDPLCLDQRCRHMTGHMGRVEEHRQRGSAIWGLSEVENLKGKVRRFEKTRKNLMQTLS
jgi:hypothetical protein